MELEKAFHDQGRLFLFCAVDPNCGKPSRSGILLSHAAWWRNRWWSCSIEPTTLILAHTHTCMGRRESTPRRVPCTPQLALQEWEPVCKGFWGAWRGRTVDCVSGFVGIYMPLSFGSSKAAYKSWSDGGSSGSRRQRTTANGPLPRARSSIRSRTLALVVQGQWMDRR